MNRKYIIKVHWKHDDTIQMWNEKMAWVTEQFGLPGGKWQSEVTSEWMAIYFDDEKDYVFAKLKLGT